MRRDALGATVASREVVSIPIPSEKGMRRVRLVAVHAPALVSIPIPSEKGMRLDLDGKRLHAGMAVSIPIPSEKGMRLSRWVGCSPPSGCFNPHPLREGDAPCRRPMLSP